MTITFEDIERSKIYIYGTGTFGVEVFELSKRMGLKVESFIDHFENPQFLLKEVIRVDELSTLEDFTVILGVCNLFGDLSAISNSILDRNPRARVISPVQLAKICFSKGLKLENYWLTGDTGYISRSTEEIEFLKEMLYDESSRNLVDAIVRYRTTGFVQDIPQPDNLNDQYLPANLPTPPTSLRMLELGAFKGEDLLRFVSRGRIFDLAFCVEPDIGNYNSLVFEISRSEIPNVYPIPTGAWSETSQLKFKANGKTGAQLSENGEGSITVMRFDDLVGSNSINYIKMDIEGAELAAIEGLEKTIVNQLPHLALSVYHKPEDLWEIPRKIRLLAPDAYNFYLRVYGHQTFDTVLYCVPK